jgi:hypothetical protein
LNELNDDQPLEVANLPGVNGKAPAAQPHTQIDLLGLMSGGGLGSPLDKLIEGSDQFMEWAVRGNRSDRERVAEVYIMGETMALKSAHFPVRSRFMKAVHKQEALASLMTVQRTKMTKQEFWLIILGMGMILGVLFLITSMVGE